MLGEVTSIVGQTQKARKERTGRDRPRLAGLYQKASRKTSADNESFVSSLFEAHPAAKRLFELYHGPPEKHQRHCAGGARQTAQNPQLG